MGVDPPGEERVALHSLSLAYLLLSSILAGEGASRSAAPPARTDGALAATTDEPDATTRARARVEMRYRAGDLPGALHEALDGLKAAPEDLPLLRRALELETALRVPELASGHAARLEAAVKRSSLDEEARRWWEREVKGLVKAADDLAVRESMLRSATLRARWVSQGILGAVIALILVLGRSAPRDGATKMTPPASG